jgi:hypothetical protein
MDLHARAVKYIIVSRASSTNDARGVPHSIKFRMFSHLPERPSAVLPPLLCYRTSTAIRLPAGERRVMRRCASRDTAQRPPVREHHHA